MVEDLPDPRKKSTIHKEVIQAPTAILLPLVESVAPPSIASGIWIEFPEGVYQSELYQCLHVRPLIGGIAQAGQVLAHIFRIDVDLRPSDIEITADDDGLQLSQLRNPIYQELIPLQAISMPNQVLLRVWHIGIDQVKPLIL